MRPIWGTIALSAATVALAGEGCLLAYDFEEYGAGGASSESSASGTTETSSSSSATTGGGADFEPCLEGEVSYVVLPDTWTDVRVAQFGRGFVAAPRDVLEYIVLPEPVMEGWRPTVYPRVTATDGLLGLFRLSVEENDERVVGIRSDGEDLKLKALDFGSGSEPFRANFVSARQFAGEGATLLVTVEASKGTATQAQMLTPYWDGSAPALARSLEGLIDLQEEPDCPVGTCSFRSAVALTQGDEFVVAYLGQGLTEDAVVGGDKVGTGPFVFAAGRDADGEFTDVLELDFIFDEAFEVGPGANYFSGIKGGMNATVRLFEDEFDEPVTFGTGVAQPAHPSRFAKEHWMVTQFLDGAPEVAVFELKAGAGADAVFAVGGVTGFDIASAPRTLPTQVGLLVSVQVPEGDDVVRGSCTLPAGRSVLVQRNVDAP